jgi:hypothetical protein
VLNLAWAHRRHPDWRIERDPRVRPRHRSWYYRVSPDLAAVRAAAADFYADLAVYAPLDGVLFDDDAFMLPDEPLVGSGALDPALKAEAIDAMIAGIVDTVRQWRPGARFGRNLYAAVALEPGLHPLFAQDLERTLDQLDLAVVMAYARMEGEAHDPAGWIADLVDRTLSRVPGGAASRVLFKLQAYDWKRRRWIASDELTSQARAARAAGALSLGVYPVVPAEGALPDNLLADRSRSPEGLPARGGRTTRAAPRRATATRAARARRHDRGCTRAARTGRAGPRSWRPTR